MEPNVASRSCSCHGFFMRFTVDGKLLEGGHGISVARAALAAGWITGEDAGDFLFTPGDPSVRMMASFLPCRAGSWAFCLEIEGAKTKESPVPAAAKVPTAALLAGMDGTSASPASVTLVAGDLLLSGAGSEEELCRRIIGDWDWWLALRQSTRELAVAWSSHPSNDILLLFNMLDAGNLDEPFEQPLAAGRATCLVGWHPVTALAAEAAGIAATGCPPAEERTLVNRRAIFSDRFWKGLAENYAESKA